ncbi:MAG: hypothetical protein IT160_13690 [Bryobacterales bacterium]|nr:hypothetical protein [Bryobacterales bacterium]
MSYIQVLPKVEFDPATNKIRSGGQERDAGFAAIGFSLNPEVREALAELYGDGGRAAQAGSIGTEAGGRADSPWAPYDGPVDSRDAVPTGIGLLTSSGAPLIEISSQAAANVWDYTGPASRNPYFCTSSNPLRTGYVKGYDNWFEAVNLLGPNGYVINSSYTANQEGAAEALRIVRQFVPDATLTASVIGEGTASPWRSDKAINEIELPNGERVNAGRVLAGYYNNGMGVDSSRDALMRYELALHTGEQTINYG